MKDPEAVVLAYLDAFSKKDFARLVSDLSDL